MDTSAVLDVPEEVLRSARLSAERLAARAVVETALALYRDGSISSALAAQWLREPRTAFLLRASKAGIPLLENSPEDFERERTLL